MHIAAVNLLDREFEVAAPDTVWAIDFTFIRIHEGWMYLAVVVDLFSRQVIGWAMRDQTSVGLVLQAPWSAVWRPRPGAGVMVHLHQGSVYTGDDWQKFLSSHGVVRSISRRGNCHDNAQVESFFGLLQRERVRRRIYPTMGAARSDVFDYIQMFCNPKRRHDSNDDVSPVKYERRYAQRGP